MVDGPASGEKEAPGTVRPGTLTALLHEIAEAPVPALDGWEATLRPGATVGRFELVRELGRGGFGVVWEAKDRELGRSVALKAVRAGGRTAVREERLLREAEAAARLAHTNIVTLFDVGRVEAGPYLVLELLRGETLEGRLAKGKLPVPEAIRIAVQIASGVAHAHAEGVVHRDLKPANVFVCDDGRVKVLDFGLAHAFGQRKQDGGTRGYMAPEQIEGAPEDERTDVWALGAILFELLAGKRPFEDEEALRRPAPALEVPGLPALGTLVARMLATRPVDRPRDGGEVVAALAAAARDLEGAPVTALVRMRSQRGKGALVAALLSLVAVAGAVAGAVASWRVTHDGLAGPDGRIVLAVADFANDTRDPDLDGLSGLLITSLQQSPGLTVLTRGRMLELARQVGSEDVERIDEALARAVGRKAGARALLLVRVRRFDDVYTVELHALDPAEDDHLFALKEQAAGKRSVPELIDRLSARARRALRAPDEERSTVPVAEVATANLEAYRHYFLGLQRLDQLRIDEARAELAEALRIEPGLALAHVQLLDPEFWPSERDRQRHLEAALAGIDRLPEAERLIVRAEEAVAGGRVDDAFTSYERALARFPGDKRVLHRMFWMSLHVHGNLRAAAGYAERALELDPEWPLGQDALVTALLWAGAFERAETMARDWVERWPTLHTMELLNRVLLHSGKTRDALTVAQEAGARSGRDPRGASMLQDTLMALGDIEGVARSLRALASRGEAALSREAVLARYRGQRAKVSTLLREMERRGDVGRARALRLWLSAGDGNPARVLAMARDSATDVPPASVAASLALAGHAAEAETLLREHAPGRYASLAVPPRVVAILVAALRARDGGDLAGARRTLEDLRRDTSRPAAHAAALILGEVCFASGDHPCAVEALAEFQAFHFMFVSSAWAYPRSLYFRAAAEERQGRREEARATLGRLLALWKGADHDLPLLADAKALQARLATAAGAPAAAKPTSAPSIAVLPFADLSPGKDQEYFADGVAEEILNALTRVRGLKVVGRTSSFSFKGRSDDLMTIGRKLRATHIVEGSLRLDRDRVRVTAHLVKAADGYRVWSETYERDLSGIFAVQDAIARAIVAALEIKLLAGGSDAPRTATVTHPEAYQQYLLGRQLYRTFSRANFRKALQAYERALELDPRYAPAWAGLGIPLFYSARDAPSLEEERAQQRRALDAAERALELAPDLADGLSVRGFLRHTVAWDWQGGLADLERAVRIYPSDFDAWRRYAVVLDNLGRSAEAIAAASRAVQLDPLGHSILKLGQVQLCAGRLDLATASFQRAAELLPDSSYPAWNLAGVWLLEGRAQEALEVFERIASSRPGNPSALKDVARALHSLGRTAEAEAMLERVKSRQPRARPLEVASVCAWMERLDCAFAWLDRAFAERDTEMGESFRNNPEWRPIVADSRWKALLRKMNLPPD